MKKVHWEKVYNPSGMGLSQRENVEYLYRGYFGPEQIFNRNNQQYKIPICQYIHAYKQEECERSVYSSIRKKEWYDCILEGDLSHQTFNTYSK